MLSRPNMKPTRMLQRQPAKPMGMKFGKSKSMPIKAPKLMPAKKKMPSLTSVAKKITTARAGGARRMGALKNAAGRGSLNARKAIAKAKAPIRRLGVNF